MGGCSLKAQMESVLGLAGPYLEVQGKILKQASEGRQQEIEDIKCRA